MKRYIELIDTFLLNFIKRFLLIYTITLIIMITAGCATAPRINIEEPTGEYVWPQQPEIPRIKLLGEWSSKEDFGKPNPLLTFLLGPEGRIKMRRATGVVTDSKGTIYATDAERAMIFVFDQEGKTLRFLGEGELSAPIGLAIDNTRGILFVSDSKLDQVLGLDKKSGRVIMTIGGKKDFKNPSGMVYDEERQRLYVSDTQNHVLKVFDKNGNFLMQIGKKGEEDGEFNYPSFLALDRSGRLYVVDSFNFRIQIFDPDGKFIKKFGRLGDSPGAFARPAGIGVDSDGNIYVIDTAFNNFQIFNFEGQLLLWVGEGGRKPGQFALPVGLFIDKDDRIYVADTFNYRVQVFQYLKQKQ